MAGTLLATKLHIPRRRRNVVLRPRLSQRLDRCGEAALTLVSAPAGFGKTTVLTEWLAATNRRSTAWLSLDPRDNDPIVFWTYVVTALRTATHGAGAGALALLQESHSSIDGSSRAWSTNSTPFPRTWCWSWTTTTSSTCGGRPGSTG